MSRIGKQTIGIPEGVTVSTADDAIIVKGPKGELRRVLNPLITVSVEDNAVTVSPRDDSKDALALWGTYASHTLNMIEGVTKEFEKRLVLEGIGYRVGVSDNAVELSVGFSHLVRLPIPNGLKVEVNKNTIIVSGPDKEQVGQFTANIRAVKKPEPYKGKGIRYEKEIVRRKQGKKTSA